MAIIRLIITFSIVASVVLVLYRLMFSHAVNASLGYSNLFLHNEIPHSVLTFTVSISIFYGLIVYRSPRIACWISALVIPLLAIFFIEYCQGWVESEVMLDFYRSLYGYFAAIIFNGVVAKVFDNKQ